MTTAKPSGSPSPAQRDLLWTVAQHKYGWTHVSRHRGQLQVADALVRRGLVIYSADQHRCRESYHPVIVVTDAGREFIAQAWPVSPLNLGTYAHQPNGWDPRDGRTVA